MNYFDEVKRLVMEQAENLKKTSTSNDFKQGVITGMIIAFEKAGFINSTEASDLLFDTLSVFEK